MIIIYFHSSRCHNCEVTDKIFNGLKDIDNVPILNKDLSEDLNYANKYNISFVPTVIITQDSKEIVRFVDDKINLDVINNFIKGEEI